MVEFQRHLEEHVRKRTFTAALPVGAVVKAGNIQSIDGATNIIHEMEISAASSGDDDTAPARSRHGRQPTAAATRLCVGGERQYDRAGWQELPSIADAGERWSSTTDTVG